MISTIVISDFMNFILLIVGKAYHEINFDGTVNFMALFKIRKCDSIEKCVCAMLQAPTRETTLTCAITRK